MATNPNGANGTTGDPREQKCWDLYIESITNQRENAYQAAVTAGYSEDHSRNITMQGWFKERLAKLKRKDMFSKAERLLDKTMTYEPIDEEGKINVPLLAVQTKVATTLVTTLGKDEGYSTRTELTGENGIPLILPSELLLKNKIPYDSAPQVAKRNRKGQS